MSHPRLQSLFALTFISVAACGSSSSNPPDESSTTGGSTATGGTPATGGNTPGTGGRAQETGGSMAGTGGVTSDPDAGMSDDGPMDGGPLETDGGPMDASMPDVCTHTTWLDSDGDGSDGSITRRTTVASEHSETTEFDDDGDGHADRREVIISLPSGEKHERDYVLPSELLVATEDVAVNDADQPTRHQSDADADGTYESVTLYAYYDDGTLLSERVETDANDDGSPESLWLQEYDAQGRITRELRQYLGDDPSRDREETYEYVGDTVTRRSYMGGTATLVEVTVKNAAGENLTVTTDFGADGTDDQQYVRTYDSAGRLERERYDAPPMDGEWDSETVFTYDSAGRTTLVERLRRDGSRLNAERWTYSASGMLLEKASDFDGDMDGTFESRVTHTYDGMDRPLTDTTTEDDTLIRQVRYTYDDSAGTVTLERDDDGDNAYDDRSVTWLDAYGRPLRLEDDTNNDGTPESIVRHEYSCAP